MARNFSILQFVIISFMLILAASAKPLSAQPRDIELTIHLRGVYESKISVLAMSGTRVYKPIIEVPGIKNGESTKIIIPGMHLPSEFVLRFDYKEKAESTPYPSEKNIFAYRQNLELWVSPVYCNNGDSTVFQQGERENASFAQFSKENGKKKEKLGLLQNFLLNYDDTESKFFQMGTVEYENRRQAYNAWLKDQGELYKDLFIRSLFHFQYVPQMPWKGTENERIYSMIDHYFDGMDFNDTLLLKTSFVNKWMDNYVNLYGQLSTTTALRDSLFPLAGKNAIDKAKQGHPLVYGWMVDYFYRGYESNGIDAGMKILEPYLNDPKCLTSKRQEILRRLEGMKTLVPGSVAPEITMSYNDGKPFELSKLQTSGKYILVLFWSAGCSHCVELTSEIYPWMNQPEISKEFTVVAISMDESESEIKAWEQKIKEYDKWNHLLAQEGVRSKQASDYYVLATPVMVLLEASTKKIVAVPNTFKELQKALK